MPKAPVGGIELYYEEVGSGESLVFCHEFAGDLRSWEPQVRHFSRRYRVITYNARGYPPSDVPTEVSAYSQRQAVVHLSKNAQSRLPNSRKADKVFFKCYTQQLGQTAVFITNVVGKKAFNYFRKGLLENFRINPISLNSRDMVKNCTNSVATFRRLPIDDFLL
jgi:hypothetical protein